MAASAITPETTPGAAFPLDAVAPVLVLSSSRQVARVARSIRRDGPTPRRVHRLRVATRRLEAVTELVTDSIGEQEAARLLGHCKFWRRLVAKARQLDVAIGRLKQLRDSGEDSEVILKAVVALREKHLERVRRKILHKDISSLQDDASEAARVARPPMAGPRLFSDAAVARILAVTDEMSAHFLALPESVEDVHALRLSLKRLRYLVELSAACVPPELCSRVLNRLSAEQETLGTLADLGDFQSVVESLKSLSRRGIAERDAVLAEVEAERGRLFAGVRDRHGAGVLASLVHELRAWASDASVAMPRDLVGTAPSENAVGRTEPRDDRIAVIDVGSNSVRLLVVEVLSDGTYRTLDDEKETTRLGQGLVSTGMLASAPMVKTAQCIARMRGIAQGYGVSKLRVIGTSAVRDATNQREFLALVRENAAVTLEIMSEEDEARNAFRSAAAGFDLSDVHAAVVDIGGGSTEIVLSTKGVIELVCSIPIGAVRVSEMFAERGGEALVKRMRRYVARCLRQALPTVPLVPTIVVGTGGTFTALATLAGAKDGASGKVGSGVPGAELRRSEVRHLLDRLGSMGLRDRMRLPRMSPERADIIVGGAAIAEGVLRHLDVNRLWVHEKGVRDGLVISMIAESRAPAPNASSGTPASRVLGNARRFADSCRYEKAHSEQVARLAVSIFDQMVRHSLLGRRSGSAEARLLLEVASVLHDIGYLVNYAGHHKHSLRLILNSDLQGLTRRQIAIVANVARYHRRAEPASRHGAYSKLSKSDRRLVRQLAAVLRVADGLDRAHSQLVEEVRLVMPRVGEGDREILFSVRASERPTTDLWGAERKMGLLEREFGVKGICQWELPPVPRRALRLDAVSNGVGAH